MHMHWRSAVPDSILSRAPAMALSRRQGHSDWNPRAVKFSPWQRVHSVQPEHAAPPSGAVIIAQLPWNTHMDSTYDNSHFPMPAEAQSQCGHQDEVFWGGPSWASIIYSCPPEPHAAQESASLRSTSPQRVAPHGALKRRASSKEGRSWEARLQKQWWVCISQLPLETDTEDGQTSQEDTRLLRTFLCCTRCSDGMQSSYGIGRVQRDQ